MERMKVIDCKLVEYHWQPGDGTHYALLLSGPVYDGRRLFQWLNGRSSRKNQDPLPVLLPRRFNPLSKSAPKQLGAMMKLVEYDRAKLCEFLAEVFEAEDFDEDDEDDF